MKMLLKDKIALVTGGAKGIGAGCAVAFAKNGAKVVIVDLDEDSAKETITSINDYSSGIFVKADVSNEDDVKAVFDVVKAEYGRLDILMNVAGICSTNTIFIETMGGWDKMMDINLKGAFLFMRNAFLMMQEQKYGKVISVSSISGQVGGIRTSPAYAASKAGILSVTKSFAKLGATDNITVNAIAPGIIDTQITQAPDFHYSIDEVPMKRVGTPQEVAQCALFLASDMSSYITGQCINVNGGMYMG
jgi:3-oxoacyl-[acyl-carrier protein] reductase